MTRTHDVSAAECLAIAALLEIRAHEELEAARQRHAYRMRTPEDRDTAGALPALADTWPARAARVLRAEADRLLTTGRKG